MLWAMTALLGLVAVSLIGAGLWLLLVKRTPERQAPVRFALDAGKAVTAAAAGVEDRPASLPLEITRPKTIHQPLTLSSGGRLIIFGLIWMGLSLLGMITFGSSFMRAWFSSQTEGWLLGYHISALCLVPLLVVIGLAILAWGGWVSRQALALNLHGQVTQGLLFDRWLETVTDSDGYPSTYYCVAYYFELPRQTAGKSWVTRAEYNSTAYHHLRIGDTTPVCYLPEDPKVCRLEMNF